MARRIQPERFVAGGDALAHDEDGRVMFVRGGVPGDTVDVEVVVDKKGWARGVVVEVLEASSMRVKPPCPQRRAGCGGCDWQHIRVDDQLPSKVEIVRDAMRRTAKLPDARLRQGASVNPVGYRTTIRVVGSQHGVASFRMEKSHDTIASTGCLVTHPMLHETIDTMRITPGLEVTLRGSAATGEITAAWDSRLGEVTSLPDRVLTGVSAALAEHVFGYELRVSARSFFQSGPQAAELLVEAVARAAPELETADVVVDAYAGVGLFSAVATLDHSRLIVLETSKSAVEDARHNLARRITHIEQVDVADWRHEISQSADVVIADPSRSGLERSGVESVVSAGAPVLVLVSCDPVSLARDAHLLAGEGYVHVVTEVLDVFPHTHHVECVTRFVKGG